MKNITEFIAEVKHSGSRKAEGLRFIITGSIATCIQYGLYLILISACSLSAVVSTVVSYFISFVTNYILSNYFTFKTRPSKGNAASFLASHIINLSLQTILVALFSKCINAEYALLPAMVICIPCNFFLVRFALKSEHFTSKK